MVASMVGWGFVAPIIVVALLSVVLAYGRRRLGRELSHLEGVIFWAGYVTAYVGLVGWPPFPPVEATQWLVSLLLLVALMRFVESRLGKEKAVWGLRFVFALLSAFLLLKPRAEFAWTTGEAMGWVGGWTAAYFAGWSLHSGSDACAARAWSVGPVLVALAGVNIALLLSGSALLSQLGGAGATTLAVLALMRPSNRGALHEAAVAPLVFLSISVILLAQTYAYLPLSSAYMIVAAFLSVAIWRVPWLSRWSRNRVLALQLFCVVGFCAAGLLMIPMEDAGSAGPW